MDKLEKQLAVNDFLFWLNRKYEKEITELALEYEADIDKLGELEADKILSEKVKILLDND